MKRALFALRLANAAILVGVVGYLLLLGIGGLGCSSPTEPAVPLGRKDSLLIEAILRVNRTTWKEARPYYSTASQDGEGRVQYLDLSGRGLDTIPPAIGELSALRSLYLGRNRIRSLPQEMEKLTELVQIGLDSNQLESLPDGFRYLGLAFIDLSGNRLRALPNNIDVTGLRVLALNDNAIESLPKDFWYLKKLRALEMRNNLLDSLPENFGELDSLARLDLWGNRLGALPPRIMNLPLEYLNVGKNRLCFQEGSDPALPALTAWLDSLDRDWKDSQTCP